MAASDEFWSLVVKKLVKVSQPGRGLIRLEGTSWVGRVRLGDIDLELVEKIPGVLASLLRSATDKAFRVERLAAPATPPGELMRILVHEFLEGVHLYTGAGRQFEYQPVRRVSSLIGGKIVMTDTVRLRGQGLRHLVAFTRDTVSHRTLKNRVVAAALRQILSLSGAWGVAAGDVFAARMLDELFSDCKDAEVLYGKRRRFAEYVEELLAEPRERHRDLLRLASVVLSNESFEPVAPTPRATPRAWFLNLETLFEAAVRLGLGNASGLSVTKPSGLRRQAVFPTEGLFQATPDLVIADGTERLVVGDVKYKNFGGTPEAQDVYQLLVHAAAYGVNGGFLVYAAAEHSVQRIGDSAVGVTVWVATVDVREVDAGLPMLLNEIGIGVQA